jgi:hypothetical protein
MCDNSPGKNAKKCMNKNSQIALGIFGFRLTSPTGPTRLIRPTNLTVSARNLHFQPSYFN